MSPHILLTLPILFPILGVALCGLFWSNKSAQRIISLVASVGLLGSALALTTAVYDGTVLATSFGNWDAPFGIVFVADMFAAAMVLITGIMAVAVGVYGLNGDIEPRENAFYHLLYQGLLLGVTGAFLTGDIFNLYVWFEVLLISSFGLITLGSEPRQIDGAIKYAFLNLIATTLFLIATGYLYGVFGTLNMADIAAKAAAGREHLPLMTLATLYLLAFGMKAAAFPVNFWLPASYHTPKVVVSALFAGLLTKVGIYALLRTLVMLFPVEREALSFVIALIGVATMLVGALGALGQSDIRRLLGYVVISGIGVMLAGLSLGSPGGIGGAIFYALHSMVVMTALYMAAGLAGRLAGSFDLNRLGGLYTRSALFSALSLVLFFAVSGLPPFSGFWPKVMVAKAAIDIGAWWLTAAVFLTGFLTTIALGRVFLLAYWRPAGEALPAEAIPVSALLPLAALTALTVIFGLFPEALLSTVQHAAEGLSDPRAYLGSVFPGMN